MKHCKRTFLLSLATVALALPSTSGALQRVPVPTGMQLLIRLDETISSKTSRVGDQFHATVVSPRSYKGAVLTGHVSHLRKSGRLEGKTELGLDFDRIQLRDRRSARLSAELLEVRQSEQVKVVDEEGNVHSGSRGKQAIKRTSIGAAIGGILGGLIGGRKGVAIGLIIGAGAGAASLVVDGSKELKLEPGTEMVIRTIRNPSHEQARSISSHVMATMRIEDEQGATDKLSENIASLERVARRQLSAVERQRRAEF